MQGQRKNATEMSVILPYHFVDFQIPAFELLVLTAREQIRMAVRDDQASDGVDVAGERDHEFSFREVPELDGAIVATTNEEPIFRIDRNTPDLARVAANNGLKLPGCMPLRFNDFAPPQHYLILVLS